MLPRHARSDGGGPSAADLVIPASPTGRAAKEEAPAASSGYSNGLLVWCLGALALLIFYLQGSSLAEAHGGVAARLGWARLQGAVAAGARRAAAAEGAALEPVELLQELTAALEEATAELEGTDREIRALRALRKCKGGSSGSSGGAQAQRSLGAAAAAGTSGGAPASAGSSSSSSSGSSSSGSAAAAAAAAPAASAASPAGADAELAEALASLPFLPLPSSSAQAPAQPCTACLRHGSGLASRLCLPAPCPYTPPAAARVISTSLYGDLPRYAWGAIRNAELMPAVFPGWRLRVYTRGDMLPSAETLAQLRGLGAEVVALPSGERRSGFGMNWRFLVGDDAGVEAFLCRDSDSRVSLRDRWAAEDWLRSAAREPFHVVRDHPSHAGYKLMGGTWGARTAAFREGRHGVGSVKGLLEGWVASKGHGDYGSDIDFLSVREGGGGRSGLAGCGFSPTALAQGAHLVLTRAPSLTLPRSPLPPSPLLSPQVVLWPHMSRLGVIQHDSHSCGAGNHGVAGRPFPLPRAGTEHVGAVYVYEEGGVKEGVRAVDLALLTVNEGARGAADCLPSARAGAARAALTLEQAFAEAEGVEVEDFGAAGEEGGAGAAGAGGAEEAAAAAAQQQQQQKQQAKATAWGDVPSGSASGGGVCSTWWLAQAQAQARAAGAGGTPAPPPTVCRPAVIHWLDAWIDGARASSGGGGGGGGVQRYSAVFTYEAHVWVGQAPADAPAPAQYHERVPATVEPIAALDGGVRYYSSLAVVDAMYALAGALEGGAAGGAARDGAAAFAREDLPRLVDGGLVRPETVFLLPARAAAAVAGAAPARLAEHVLAQEEGSGSLYFARHAYMVTCKCA